MIDFNEVSVRRGTKLVLDSLTLDLAEGEHTVLLGKSGSGKSTLLRLINRLLDADSGRIRVFGQDVRHWDPHALRRRIGFVPQDLGLFPHVRVGGQIRLALRVRGAEGQAGSLLDEVELPASYATRFPHELSGGEQQRVALARALAGGTDLLLLDEPFSALDFATRRTLQDLVRGLKRSIVFVTHDIREALRMADRIAYLEDGKLKHWDSAEALRPWLEGLE
jgi:osmoprotectant transport system ATP-binding protein